MSESTSEVVGSPFPPQFQDSELAKDFESVAGNEHADFIKYKLALERLRGANALIDKQLDMALRTNDFKKFDKLAALIPKYIGAVLANKSLEMNAKDTEGFHSIMDIAINDLSRDDKGQKQEQEK